MSRRTEKLEALFEAALVLESAAERQAYLDRACLEPDLRREVESLLAAHGNPDSLLVAQRESTEPATPANAPITEQPGDQVGRYKLLEKLGEGGFGVVYMAEQREPVKRRVALKIIKVGMDTREFVARFEAERQALALMDHPNIAKVHDGGATEAGRPYFVMELVRGIKITDYCDQNQLGMEERLKLFMQVCHAVQHAHQKGIIHRDLKPSNILVTLHDGVPVPKVIDFGIAKATQQELTEKTLFTQFHQFIGTPSYMSPEQAELSGLDIDTRSDIYSLGVLLYELLAGQTPFDGQELLKAGLDAMRRKIREEEPPKPSTRLTQELVAADVRRLASKSEEEIRASSRRLLQMKEFISVLRGDLDWIVMKALEKDRTRRYETANGLAADIQRHLSNEPVVARPPSATYRFQKTVRRNKIAFAAAAAVATALVVGMSASTWLFIKERAAHSRAATAEKTAADEASIARAVSEFLRQDLLETADSDIQVGMGMPANPNLTVVEALDRAAARIDERFGNQPLVEAAIRLTIGKTYSGLGDYRRALPHLERSLELRRTHLGSQHEDTVACMRSLADTYRRSKRPAESVGLQEEIVRINSGPRSANSETLNAQQKLIDLTNLGLALTDAKRANEAVSVLEEVLQQYRATPGQTRMPVAMYFLARAYASSGQADKALSVAQEALGLQVAERGPEDRRTLEIMDFVATRLFNNHGRSAEALPLFEEIYKQRRLQLGSEHAETLLSMQALGVAYRVLGRSNDAASILRESANLMSKVEDKRPGRSARGLSLLGDHYFNLKQYAEAGQAYSNAVALARKGAANDPRSLAVCLGDYAPFLKNQKRWVEAELVYREVLELHRTLLPPTHEEIIDRTAWLGRFLVEWALDETTTTNSFDHAPRMATPRSALEHAREAERLLRKCMSYRRVQTNAPPKRIVETQGGLGGALLALAIADPELGPEERLARWQEAERLLIQAHDGLLQIKSASSGDKHKMLERLIRLYDEWKKPDQAAAWRQKLEALNKERAEQKAAANKEASQ